MVASLTSQPLFIVWGWKRESGIENVNRTSCDRHNYSCASIKFVHDKISRDIVREICKNGCQR